MPFPANNLPTQSKYWGREVEKKITNLEGSLKSSEINNTTRDSQLQVTATQAVVAAQLAQSAAEDAADAAVAAGAASTTASNAINGLISLGNDGSTYDINAGNISGGTITGTLLNTASSGARIEMGLNNVLFYDDSGDYSGKIDAEGNGRGSTLNIDHQGVSGIYIYNGGVEVYANGVVGINSQGLAVYGAEISSSSISTGAVGCSSVSSTGSISGSSVSGGSLSSSGGLTVSGNSDLQGRIISSGTYDAVASSTANVLINSNNYFQRTTSSRRYKSDIQDVDYGMVGLDLQPRTWVDRSAYEENGNSADGLTRITGFIAEEIHDLGLTELVQYNDDGTPEAVNYDRMLVTVIPVIKKQQELIEQLTARIEALESR